MSKAKTLADTVSTGGPLATPGAVNLPGGAQGSVPYQSGVGQTALLAPGTAGHVLTSGGAGANPTWAAAVTAPAGSTGQVQINNAGAFGAVASGTSGQVLTSAGAGAAPTWTTPSAGAWEVLSSGTISNVTTVDFETGFTNSAYSAIVILLYDVFSNGSGNASFRFKQGGSWQGTSYYSQTLEASGSSVSGSRTANAAQMVFSGAQVLNNVPYTSMLIVNNRFSIVDAGPALSTLVQTGSGVEAISIASGVRYASGAVTGVRFLLSGGGGSTTITSGKYVTYGIKAS